MSPVTELNRSKTAASMKPTERKSRTAPKSLTLQDIRLFQDSTKLMVELFEYRVVLNGIALARSPRKTLFIAYLTYRAFVRLGCHDGAAFSDRFEHQSTPRLWRLHPQ